MNQDYLDNVIKRNSKKKLHSLFIEMLSDTLRCMLPRYRYEILKDCDHRRLYSIAGDTKLSMECRTEAISILWLLRDSSGLVTSLFPDTAVRSLAYGSPAWNYQDAVYKLWRLHEKDMSNIDFVVEAIRKNVCLSFVGKDCLKIGNSIKEKMFELLGDSSISQYSRIFVIHVIRSLHERTDIEKYLFYLKKETELPLIRTSMLALIEKYGETKQISELEKIYKETKDTTLLKRIPITIIKIKQRNTEKPAAKE